METEITIENRGCMLCSKPLRGRTDKKFCNDYCRNNYNNQARSASNKIIRNINNALCKNRRILDSMIKENEERGKTCTTRLLLDGFQFKYYTHTLTNKKGGTYYFCYDHGYMPMANDEYLLIRKKEG